MRGRPTGRRAAGVLLLEVLLALALFVVFGMMTLSVLGRGADALVDARLRAQAADMTRSAMAKLEAGIESAESLNGPVDAWVDEDAPGGFDDTLPEPTPWSLEIETEPAQFGDLTRVRIVAMFEESGSGEPRSMHSLEQLVALRR